MTFFPLADFQGRAPYGAFDPIGSLSYGDPHGYPNLSYPSLPPGTFSQDFITSLSQVSITSSQSGHPSGSSHHASSQLSNGMSSLRSSSTQSSTGIGGDGGSSLHSQSQSHQMFTQPLTHGGLGLSQSSSNGPSLGSTTFSQADRLTSGSSISGMSHGSLLSQGSDFSGYFEDYKGGGNGIGSGLSDLGDSDTFSLDSLKSQDSSHFTRF